MNLAIAGITPMTLEFRVPHSGVEAPLANFFAALRDAGDGAWFHPHPLDRANAERICTYQGQDVYYVAVDDGAVVAYGFLRGWDDGFDVPSLGLAVHPERRGGGLGRELMEVLHRAARRRGSTHIRLRVYPDNLAAIALYQSLGYAFEGEDDDGQLLAHLELA